MLSFPFMPSFRSHWHRVLFFSLKFAQPFTITAGSVLMPAVLSSCSRYWRTTLSWSLFFISFWASVRFSSEDKEEISLPSLINIAACSNSLDSPHSFLNTLEILLWQDINQWLKNVLHNEGSNSKGISSSNVVYNRGSIVCLFIKIVGVLRRVLPW